MDVTIPLVIPGYERQYTPYDLTLAPQRIDSREWFSQFVNRVYSALGKAYLPVCRAADGEFLLLFGHQPPSLRWTTPKRMAMAARSAALQMRARIKGFKASTAIGVSSGEMSWREWGARRESLASDYQRILENGILAMQLNFSIIPCQEHFFPALARWLKSSGVSVTLSNHVPFYFVYAILRGPRRHEILVDRNLVVIHSAAGEKRHRIENALRAEGVRSIQWIPISPSRSFDDIIDLSTVSGRPDLCLVGAGVGKAAVFSQLSPLNIPCLDAGFVFEVWADPDKRWDRPMMVADDEYDLDRIRFLTEEVKAFTKASHQGDYEAVTRLIRQIRRVHSIREM